MKKRKLNPKNRKSGSSNKLQLTKMVKNIIDQNLEIKDRVNYYSFNNPAASYYNEIRVACSIAQGIDDNQRIGNKIKLDHIQYSFYIESASTTNWEDAGFVSLVLDKQNNNATTATTAIYNVTAGQTLGIAHRNTEEYSERFVVLKTTEWKASLNGSGPFLIREYYSFKSLPESLRIVEFNTTGGGAADVATNCLYLVFAGARTYAAASLSKVIGTSKLSYTDA